MTTRNTRTYVVIPTEDTEKLDTLLNVYANLPDFRIEKYQVTEGTGFNAGNMHYLIVSYVNSKKKTRSKEKK